MADWLVARIAQSRHEYAARCAGQMDLPFFYPQWRKVARGRTEVRGRYPGFAFMHVPLSWYSVMDRCSAILGVLTDRHGEPLVSSRLDRHVRELLMELDEDGYLRPPRESRFLRGMRVRVESKLFRSEVIYMASKGNGGAVVMPVEGALPLVVWEADLHSIV